eukprot:CAMPEP_0173206772 /NCGR_PEP_ID=MMETSP1141-20130122/21547_1 /TAXON_ID=483371 /ORGANISM="non described non described, Strain CCMP2298" /LENGTH=32 /DNA_ID= /DNA_START= /DNA_END= /DNA_ORIENTATION=
MAPTAPTATGTDTSMGGGSATAATAYRRRPWV